jgi:hypothetical protein
VNQRKPRFRDCGGSGKRLVEPFDLGKVKSSCPVGKEQLEELGKKLLQQGLESLIVIGHAAP